MRILTKSTQHVEFYIRRTEKAHISLEDYYKFIIHIVYRFGSYLFAFFTNAAREDQQKWRKNCSLPAKYTVNYILVVDKRAQEMCSIVVE